MVTASTSNAAGGAVSHPFALIPRFLPGRSSLRLPGRFMCVAKLVCTSYREDRNGPQTCWRRQPLCALLAFYAYCRPAQRVAESLPFAPLPIGFDLVYEAVHTNVHDHAQRQERKQNG